MNGSMHSYTITPMLDEEDSTPVFEVKDALGHWSTNAVSLDRAFDLIRQRIEPARTLEQIAADWIKNHGTLPYDDMRDDIREEAEIPLTDAQLGSIIDLIESAEVVVRFHA